MLSQETIEQLIQGSHTDAFSVLGMHKAEDGSQSVNVFLPGAESVKVVSLSGKTTLGTLQNLHPEGVFSGKISRKKRVPYRLKVKYPQATQLLLDDPYRFPSLLDEDSCYLFASGEQEQAWRFLGANHREVDGCAGILFAVWAPNASRVSVVGDFNHWDGRVHRMRKHPGYGIWDIFIPGVSEGAAYKYEIFSAYGVKLPLKADPYAKAMQLRPDDASVVPQNQNHNQAYKWNDKKWIQTRAEGKPHEKPLSIYEVHAGSWSRKVEEGNRFLTYREMANELIPYAKNLGFTHIQFMPLSEFPFDGSWGYQPLGMYAPTSRFGSADDLRYFVDQAHQAGIGVLVDWVPGHFPSDEHGLGRFDGSHLYEHEDLRKGFHPDWNTLIYNYGRKEVCSFLLSNAFYWLEEFHIDGLRVDAVASMLYLDYSRKEGTWLPNEYGGRENLEAIALLKDINNRVYFNFPGIMMIAEESTAWPGVTDFTENGGLGFGFKWNLGWMNDTLSYMGRDPIHRKYHHYEMTFGLLYAFSENFILPLSHDEVVHGKRSIIGRIPGDEWQKFAGLRAYYGFMFGHPGKKLLFMGDEIGQHDEWNHDRSLDWHLLEYPLHSGVSALVKDLNSIYGSIPALYENDGDGNCFEWIDGENHGQSVFVFIRHSRSSDEFVIVATNMTPTPQEGFRLGVPEDGFYEEILNTNSEHYGGTGQGNFGGVQAVKIESHGRPFSIEVVLPPLATLMFKGLTPYLSDHESQVIKTR